MHIKRDTLPISEARKELPELVERVGKLHNRFFITKRGRVEAVIMSVEEFESWSETLDILSSNAEVKALKRAEKQVKNRKGHTFEEIFGEKL